MGHGALLGSLNLDRFHSTAWLAGWLGIESSWETNWMVLEVFFQLRGPECRVGFWIGKLVCNVLEGFWNIGGVIGQEKLWMVMSLWLWLAYW